MYGSKLSAKGADASTVTVQFVSEIIVLEDGVIVDVSSVTTGWRTATRGRQTARDCFLLNDSRYGAGR